MRPGIASSFRSRPAIRLSRTCSSWRRWRWGSIGRWSDHPDSNQDRTGYEAAALPVELWARTRLMLADFGEGHKRPRVSGDPSAGAPKGGRPREAVPGSSRLEEAPQLLRARRVPEFPERLGLDLPDALPGDREVLAHLFQRARAAVGEPEAEPENLLLARREGG